ncbi:PGF-pre-PGF domain-containing protein [Haloferax mediterranei ATCC 33500]|nr:PGF-pre-PGF domain-containing protein [Haloferax mediterranei]AHZ23288.1 Muc19 precursor [Haloferax mediterranei ATCC 33500]ELZ99453.1 hypothetical protein C439_12904 [Haloferax mediterranei ATCC 33500]MDX5987342.1 PGF-pre-PGF domain-containing protein [Haloferax mediterranei ATCC 33500]QCQ76541.1 PGF-pre-PGF domain-containing protein [Haloferax mediterranei ATCC 33500]
MVISVFAGPVSASLGSATHEVQPGGPPAQQLDTVPSDQLTTASENISVWDGAFLTLRPNTSDSRFDSAQAYKVKTVDTFVKSSVANKDLQKNPVYVYNAGSEVPFTFEGVSNDQLIDGKEVQLVAAKMEKGASVPRNISAVAQKLTNDEDVTASVVGSTTGTENENSFSFTPNESGLWMFAVATVDDGTGFSDTDSDGNLETNGNVTFVGVDALPVHEGSSSVDVPELAGNGQNVTVSVDASSLDASEVTHTVAIFNESDLTKYDQTINATDRSNITLETEIARVNGTGDIPSNANIMGVAPGSQSYSGSVTALSVFERFNNSTSNFDNISVVGPKATVHGSAVAKVAGNQTTVEVPIADDAPAGEYVVMHVATNQSGTNSVTDREPLQVAESVQLNLTANTTSPLAGNDVKFTVTREDTGATVEDANVTVDGTSMQTNANGVATVPVDTSGTLTATVSKAVAGGEVFADDTLALDVQSPATFEYSNLTVEPRQVLPGSNVTVNATIENVGDIAGSYNATLVVDGTAQTSSTGNLTPGQSTTVSFTKTFNTAGSYNVTIDERSTESDELISKSVRVVAAANSSVTNVSVAPSTIDTAERYSITATVENTGGLSDVVDLTYTVSNESTEEVYNTTQTLVVGPDATEQKTVSTLAPQELGSDDIENFTVEVNDVEANTKLTVAKSDRLPPTIRLQTPSQGLTPYGTPINLSVTDGSGVDSATYSFGNDSKTLSLDANGTATIATDSLEEGQKTLTVTATDTEGNELTRTFEFDFVSSPRIKSVTPTDVVGPSSTINATFADNRHGSSETGINASATTLVIDGQTVDLSGATTNTESALEIDFSELGVSLTEGEMTAKLTVEDDAGHATSRLFTFEYDETKPTADLSTDISEHVSANNTVNVTLDAGDANLETAQFVVEDSNGDAVYTRDVTTLAQASDDSFVVEWDATDDSGNKLSNGNYNLTLVSTDAGDNSQVGNATVSVDNNLPTYDLASIDGTDSTVYTNDSVNVTYSTDENVTIVYTLESETGVKKTFTRTSGQTSGADHTLDVTSALSDGTYSVKATVTDEANNERVVTRNNPVVVDTTKPGIAATLDFNEATGNLTVNVTSTESLATTPDAEVTYPNSNTEALTLTKVGSTTWTDELDTNASGEYTLDVSGTDLAGNSASDTSTSKVEGHNFSDDKTVLLVSASGDTFIHINASDSANLPDGQTVITLSDTNVPPNALSQGTAATRYLEANSGLSDDQIEEVSYGFSEDLDTTGQGFYITYIENGGTKVLPTERQTDPFGLNGDYYVGTRGGLSTYGAMVNDTTAPTITFDTPAEGATFNETENTVDVNATLSDDVEVNESSVTVTLDNGTDSMDVTGSAAITNESVNYTTHALAPGDYTVTIEASDTNLTANTATEQVNFTIEDDREAPSFTSFNPTEGETFPFGTSEFRLNATYEEASDAVNDTGIDTRNITVLYDGEDITSAADVTASGFDTNVTVSDTETHNLTVRVPDKAGNSIEQTTNFSVTADDTDPAVEITNPAEGDELSNTTTYANVTATVSDAESGVNLSSVAVTFDGTEVTSAANLDDLSNIWFNKTGLEPGTSHTVVVSAADADGNVNQSTVNFTVAPDETAPEITRVSSKDQTFDSTGTLAIEVNYTDPESGIDASAVTLLLDGEDVTENATVHPNPGASLELSSSDIGSGEHQLGVHVTNNNGDLTANETTFSVSQGSDIQVTNAGLNTTDVQINDPVEVSATVENFGDEDGTMALGVTGESQAGTTDFGVTKSVEVNASESKSVNFVITPDDAGTYSVMVNGTTTTNALTVTSPNADIQVLSESSVSPTTLLENEETTVTVTLGNLGGSGGTISGDVTRNGSTVYQIPSTTIASGAKKTFTFTDTPPSTGDYVYTFNGAEVGTVTVSQRAPSFSVDAGSSSISEQTVKPDETFTVSVDVDNVGTARGTFSKALKANGTALATESVTLDAGGSSTLTYSTSIDSDGNYTLTVDGVTLGTITVKTPTTGGGGGGGGGDDADDAYESGRLFHETQFDAPLKGGESVSAANITFSNETTGQVTVEERTSVPGIVGEPAETAVGYVKIQVPASARDEPSTLTFSVRQSRLDDLDLSASDLQVQRFNGDTGEWEALDTRVVNESSDTVVLEAETPGFSYFAITSKQVTTTTTEPPTTTTTEPPTTTDEPPTTDESPTTTGEPATTGTGVPGFGAVLAVIALLAVALIAVRRD